MDAPGLRHLVDLRVELGDPVEIGPGRAGWRRIAPILGGTVAGRLSGRILDLGGHWQTLLADGVCELDTRCVIEADDGALVDVRSRGIRRGPADVLSRLSAGEAVDPALYHLRSHPRFETGTAGYAWLNRIICIGTGAHERNALRLTIFEVV